MHRLIIDVRSFSIFLSFFLSLSDSFREKQTPERIRITQKQRTSSSNFLFNSRADIKFSSSLFFVLSVRRFDSSSHTLLWSSSYSSHSSFDGRRGDRKSNRTDFVVVVDDLTTTEKKKTKKKRRLCKTNPPRVKKRRSRRRGAKTCC